MPGRCSTDESLPSPRSFFFKLKEIFHDVKCVIQWHSVPSHVCAFLDSLTCQNSCALCSSTPSPSLRPLHPTCALCLWIYLDIALKWTLQHVGFHVWLIH